MDNIAEKLAKWFGSSPFIVAHIVWFGIWTVAHLLFGFDQEWSTLTLIVSLEAIFLSLFILRAENVQAERFERRVNEDVRDTKRVLHSLAGLKAARTRRHD